MKSQATLLSAVGLVADNLFRICASVTPR